MNSAETDTGLLLEDEALRDGLQIESRIFSLEEKLHLIQKFQWHGFGFQYLTD